MKKMFLFCLLSIAIITSGCVKCSYDIEINNKDDISITEVGAMNLSMIASFDPSVIGQYKKELKKAKDNLVAEGYTVEDYSADGFTGIKSNKTYKIKDYKIKNLPKGFTTKQETPVSVKKGFFKKTYTIDLTYNIKNSDTGLPITNSTSNSDSDFGNAFGNMLSSAPGMTPTIDLTIKLPTTAKEHNATEILLNDTYKWSLISNEPVDIKISYEKLNWLNIILLTIVLIIGLFFIIAVNDKSSTGDFTQHF